ncbi:MAG TPA: purine-nucleoside phosphorylase [Gemmatimonadaceae bacterium]|nr:purine-nucleoside phosphorylase [Gemmatimonadaceae bacterium]
MTAIAAREAVDRAALALGERLAGWSPRAALILGSGLGTLATRVAASLDVPFAEVPGFPGAGVHGHSGRIVAGTLEDVPVLAFAGRWHLYEGYDAAIAALPVRAAHALGARALVVSNAAGGIRRTLRAGDLMIIRDHINLTWRNPLAGPVALHETRFPDMSAPYDPELIAALRAAAASAGIALGEGVYAAVLGPSYETPAEIRMLERLGADAVGMSTVTEVIAARALGLRVAGVSLIANPAAGLGGVPVDHAGVLAAGERAARDFERVVRGFLRRAFAPPASR